MYTTDIEKSNAAKGNGIVKPKDYEIHLTWNDATTIRVKEGKMFWQKNLGWLKNWNKNWKSGMTKEYIDAYEESEAEREMMGVLAWEDLRSQIYSLHPEYYCKTTE